MSILIKGARVPHSCSVCPYGYDNGCDVAGKYPPFALWFKGRPEWCPMIELPPHGDLIDRDALVNFLYMQIFPKDITTITAVNMAAGWLKEYPVFIEAENEDV